MIRSNWIAAGAIALAGIATAWTRPAHADAILNGIVTFGILYLIFLGSRERGRAGDFPFPRGRWKERALIGGAALAVSARTLTMPWLADDYCLLNSHGHEENWWRAVFAVAPGELWYRPTAWFFWKCYHWLSPDNGLPGHAVSILLFVMNACLVAPALRRCGVPRGIAGAAALLFALNPVAVDIVAWPTNQFSLLAWGFGLLTIVYLPFRKRGFVQMLPSCAFALLAFHSKEESWLLPLICVLALARFRVRNLKKSALEALPLFVILIFSVVLRIVLLSGIGGYTDAASGKSLLLEKMFAGPIASVTTECPSRYFLPLRPQPEILLRPQPASDAPRREALFRLIFTIIPVIAISIGCALSTARRFVVSAVWIILLCVAPTSSMFPIGYDLANVRWLYAPSIGFSLIAASLFTMIQTRQAWSWVFLLIYGAASVVAGNINIQSWVHSSEITSSGLRLLTPVLKTQPDNRRILIFGLPSEVMGAQCFNCGLPDSLRRASGRFDLEILRSTDGVTRFDEILQIDTSSGVVRSVPTGAPSEKLIPDQPVSFHFGSNPALISNFYILGANLLEVPGRGVLIQTRIDPGFILSPALERPAGARVLVQPDVRASKSGAKGAAEYDPPLAVMYRSDNGFEIRPIRAGQPFALPEQILQFHIGFPLPGDFDLLLRKVEIRAQK